MGWGGVGSIVGERRVEGLFKNNTKIKRVWIY